MDKTVEIPKSLDWVKARSECSVERMFVLLRETMDTDVKSVQAIQPHINYRIERISDSKFVVARQWDAGGIPSSDAVTVERVSNSIQVRNARTEKDILSAAPSIQTDGECKLHVADVPQELWQVSRRALEALFFRP